MNALAPTYARYPVEFVSGSGCVLVDSEGTEYLDFLSGIAVNNCGHCHPRVVAAIQEQAAHLCTIAPAFANGTRSEAARLIASRHPIRHVRYELEEVGVPTLAEVLEPIVVDAEIAHPETVVTG